MIDKNRLVVTGISTISALGTTHENTVESLRRSVDCFSCRSAPEWTGCDTMAGAWVRDFTAGSVIPPMKSRRMGRSSQMAIVAADAALRQAGWSVEREGSRALGVFVGSGFCGTHSSISIVQTLVERGAEEASAAAFPNTVPNAPAGLLAIHFGLEGPSATLLQTGTTAEAALLYGREQLGQNQCRAALWGGVDEVTEYLWFGWRKLGWVANPSPRKFYGKPLHSGSCGFLAGEGAAMLVIEPEASALAREAKPLAVIEFATTASVEADPWGYPHRRCSQQVNDFFQAALEQCGGVPDVVLACGNGHPRLDGLEAAMLECTLNGNTSVWYPKGQVGESMASATVRAALAILLMGEGFVPGNFWLRNVEVEKKFHVPIESFDRTIHRVFVPTISAGGTLGAIMIQRYEPEAG